MPGRFWVPHASLTSGLSHPPHSYLNSLSIEVNQDIHEGYAQAHTATFAPEGVGQFRRSCDLSSLLGRGRMGHTCSHCLAAYLSLVPHWRCETLNKQASWESCLLPCLDHKWYKPRPGTLLTPAEAGKEEGRWLLPQHS